MRCSVDEYRAETCFQGVTKVVHMNAATGSRDLVRLHPDIVFWLDQSGMPEARDPEYFAQWHTALVALAVDPNVVCKISSLGMNDPHRTTASRRPRVLGCIEAFGADRCFFGSNWPVERLCSGYGDALDASRDTIADFTEVEQAQLLHTNAERTFRI